MTVRAVSNNPTSPFYNANAPNLTGQVGSLTTLLDAVLVNGFTGFTALGWTIGFTTTNKRAYLQNLTGSNNPSGMYLYVDDTGPGAGAAREARCCGFETMSAITPTGTGQFPLAGQAGIAVSASGFLAIRKSATADATVRFYTIVGSGQSFYLVTESGDWATPIACPCFFFGDIKSYKASDPYAIAIIGRFAENTANATTAEPFPALSDAGTVLNPLACSLCGHFMPRRHTGLGGSVRIGKVIDKSKAYTANGGAYTGEAATNYGFSNTLIGRYNVNQPFQSPNPVDGALWLSPVYLCYEGNLRGYLPGFWAPLHDRPLAHNDTFTVAGGNLNGKSMISMALMGGITGNGDQCIGFVETSNTW